MIPDKMRQPQHVQPQGPDWETLILDVQTDPRGMASDSFAQLYVWIYGYLEVLARKWLEARHLSVAHDGALVAKGLEHIFKTIGKFDPPAGDSATVGRVFKAWVGICCKRVWIENFGSCIEVAEDPRHLDKRRDGPISTPEYSQILLEDGEPDSPPLSRERELQRRLLDEELQKLPPSMRDAILEMEDLKSVERPQARGKQGEAAAVADKYGYSQNAVRTRRSRLLQIVRDRFKKEANR